MKSGIRGRSPEKPKLLQQLIAFNDNEEWFRRGKGEVPKLGGIEVVNDIEELGFVIMTGR